MRIITSTSTNHFIAASIICIINNTNTIIDDNSNTITFMSIANTISVAFGITLVSITTATDSITTITIDITITIVDITIVSALCCFIAAFFPRIENTRIRIPLDDFIATPAP